MAKGRRSGGRKSDLTGAMLLRGVVKRHFAAARAALNRKDFGREPEALHQLRVSLRRCRSLLREAQDVLPRGAVRSADLDHLSVLARRTNEGRDRDVHRAWLNEQLRSPLPEHLRRGLEALAAPVCPRGGEPIRSMDASIRTLGRTIARRLRRHSEVGARTLFSRMRKRALKRFTARMDRAFGELDLAAMHRARLAAKRLRYVSEPMAEWDERHAEALRALRVLQDDFGRLNDLSTLADRAFVCAESAAAAWARGCISPANAVSEPRMALRQAVAAARYIMTARNAYLSNLHRTWHAERRAALMITLRPDDAPKRSPKMPPSERDR